jgi:hypothetical protein
MRYECLLGNRRRGALLETDDVTELLITERADRIKHPQQER